MVLGWTQHYFRKRKFQKNVIDDRHNKKINSDACDYNIYYMYMYIYQIYIYITNKKITRTTKQKTLYNKQQIAKNKKKTHTQQQVYITQIQHFHFENIFLYFIILYNNNNRYNI